MDIPPPSSNSFTVYTKQNCPYCVKAKTILSNTNTQFQVVECDVFLEIDKTAFLDTMRQRTGRDYRTFPMIFDNGVFVGGYSELQSYLDKKNAFDFEI